MKPMSAFSINDALEADGWLSPDTYGQDFSEAGDFPAIYMFMQVDFNQIVDQDYVREIVYVGMSTRLSERWTAHETLRKIRTEGLWIKRLFMPSPKNTLRSKEQKYIRQYRPRWNIIGRIPGQ